jgi:hypothetical protein
MTGIAMRAPPTWPFGPALAPPPASHPARTTAAVAELVALLAFFAIVTALVFRQWLPHLGSALIGPPEDNMQDFWNTWYAAVGRQPGRFFFTDLLRFPEGTSLHLHAFAYPKVFVIALLTWIVGTDIGTLVLLQNLSLLISFPLAGIGAFYLTRHLTGSSAGALLGGFIFAFNPSHVAHAMHHAGVSSIEFIPPFVLCYLLAGKQKSPAFLALAIAFYALAALSSWYYLVYLAYFVLFHSLYDALRNRRSPRGWQLTPAVACPIAVVAMLAPIIAPMATAAMHMASAAGSGPNAYVADLLGFVAFPPAHALAPLAGALYMRFTGNAWEATVYLGIANMMLLAWIVLTGRARRAPVLRYALCGIAVFGILACGGRLHVLGQETIPLPGAALSWLPLASIMQAPSRAIVLVYLFLAIAVVEAARILWQERQLAQAAAIGLMALIVVDYVPARTLAMTPVACPAPLEVIRADPETDFGVLDLPPHGYVERNFHMLQQACHGRPIVLGNTSRRMADTLGDRLDTWSVGAQRNQLLAAKVKYIVLRPQVVRAATSASTAERPDGSLQFAWRPEDAPRSHYDSTYTVVHDGPDLAIFRVY